MVLKFCPRCKSLLKFKKHEKSILLKCTKCDYKSELKNKNFLIAKEKINKKSKIGKGVAENKDIFATYNNKCKQCGYNKARIIDMGIFYSDEDNLILIQCGKCGFSERIGEAT